jgi:Universal stress protein UspA and related nucleotide-binding proteins
MSRTANPRSIMVALAEPHKRVQPVLARATQLAEAVGAELLLFHSAFESALSGRPHFDSKRLARARGWRLDQHTRALERHAQKLRKRGITVDTLAVWGEPAHESIIRAVIRDGVDMVVAGPHEPRRNNAPFPLRQTDWQLLRLCPRPLLLVRPGSPSNGPIIAALDPVHSNDKPATLDRALAEGAAALAGALGAPLIVAHSIPPALHALYESESARRQMREQVATAIHRTLKKAKTEVGDIYVVDGRPEEVLPSLAKKLRAQVLVMGAISRRGLRRFAIGDTAERTIHASPCDLLILKPAGFSLRLGRVHREPVILPNAAQRAGRSSKP